MFDFGDELTVESYRVPWLIWIQALVMFLLIILLYCFSIFDLSDTDNHTSSTASPSSSSRRVSNDAHPLSKLNTTTRFVSNRLQTTQPLKTLLLRKEGRVKSNDMNIGLHKDV
ncbi:hypothetical protein FEM48_Zijuj08G0173000 [Ziziphus jujuba var. spinosa]|uniref:Transmembrane protein n=1 Tax=Ziziphus jujuba var. spinosa TaxID=714518 RepID=A0A978V0D4_ZIZJJ|nr:hypothetical protein FEM48_Zijuj08G0173000 [Ziziphus jujuba var. spinosa]